MKKVCVFMLSMILTFGMCLECFYAKGAEEVVALPILFENRASMCVDESVLNSYTLPAKVSEYEYYCITWYKTANKEYPIVYYSNSIPIELKYYNGNLAIEWNENTRCYWWSTTDRCWVADDKTSVQRYHVGYVDDNGVFENEICYFVKSNYTLSYGGYGFFNVQEQYSAGIGYLKDIKVRRLRLTDKYGNADVTTDMHRILFDKLTTTGQDLASGGYSVRVFGQVNVLDKEFNSVTSDMELPLVYFDEFPLESMQIDFKHSDFFDVITAGTGEDVVNDLMSGWNTAILGYLRRDNIFLQVVKTNADGSTEYGGYVKLAVTSVDYATLEDTYDVSCLGPNFEDDENGYSDTSREELGLGTTYDDGNLDVEESGGVTNGAEGLTDTLTELSNLVGNFPKVIGSVLDFLPAWLKGLIYSAFGIGAVLLVIKIVT